MILRSYGIHFGFLATLSIIIGGLMYLVYGYLPRGYYLPTSFALVVASGAVVYVLMTRVEL